MACVAASAKFGDEVVLPDSAQVKVLKTYRETGQVCRGELAASVMHTTAYRAYKATRAVGMKSPRKTTFEPTDEQVRREYDRLFAHAAPVKEYRMRGILLRSREDGISAIQQIRSGKPFARVAAAFSNDPQQGLVADNPAWVVPSSLDDALSQTLITLDPSGLAADPVKTERGWHVIEVLETKVGKDSQPTYAAMKSQISGLLKEAITGYEERDVDKVCWTLSFPVYPKSAAGPRIGGKVTVKMVMENGAISEILSMSGDSIFFPSVTEGLKDIECEIFDKPVILNSDFRFSVAGR